MPSSKQHQNQLGLEKERTLTNSQFKNRPILVALLTVLLACTQNVGAQEGGQGTPKLGTIDNTTISGIYSQPIRLSHGRWEGEPYIAGGASRPTAGLANNFYLTGDLDGDGTEEAIVMLWKSSGGSGVFSYLLAFTKDNGEIVNTEAAPIGDRVQIRTARIDGKQIIIDVVQQGPGDAACCPSQKAKRNWSLVDGKLHEASPRIEGQLSLADIASQEWQLVQFDHNKPLPESVNVTLQIEGDRLSGQGPCNNLRGCQTTHHDSPNR